MRMILATLLFVGWASMATAQARHGFEPDLKTYPQATPKETLASLIAAIENKRIDYVLAQLTEPEWVDSRVKDSGKFSTVLDEAKDKLLDDPAPLKQLKQFAKDGEWIMADSSTASVSHKDVVGRQAFFRKIGDRWYLLNRVSAEKAR